MPDSRGSRFALEVLFLVALAVGLALADLRPIEIAGVMAVGWLIVALLEWAAWRDQPHYGSGLPPRYYIPQVSLPPAQPLEQVAGGYPEARDEAPTWIASAALREEMLGEWPVALTPVVDGVEQPQLGEEPERDSEPELELDDVDVHDPWTQAGELPAAPLDELEDDEYEHDAEHRLNGAPQRVAVAPEPRADPDTDPDPEPESESSEQESEPEPEPAIVLAPVAQAVARYSLDPLAEPPPRRRFRRNGTPAAAAIEVPARPLGVRALPRRAAGQD
jgi:hypothetical protein